MQKKKALMIIVIFVALAVFAATMAYIKFNVYEVIKYNYNIEITEGFNVGFKLDTGQFDWGKIPQNTTGARPFSIENTFDKPMKVYISIKGEHSEFFYPSENEFIIYPNETKNLSMNVVTPKDAPLGNYSGKVFIAFKKP